MVGSQSFGKGTVQDVTGLSSGQLKLTVSKFYRVSGDSTQHRGVLPDIEFPSVYDKDEIGESQQDNALPWDNIHSVPFKPSRGVKQYIETLTAEHQQRIARDPDFVYLVDQLALSNSWDADKAVSLNMAKRKARNKDWDTQQFLLENKRRRLKGLELHADVAAWKAANKDEEELVVDTQDTPVDGEGTSDNANGFLDGAEGQEDKAKDDEEENIAESDPMLQEAGHILADHIRLLSKPQNKQLLVQNQKREK